MTEATPGSNIFGQDPQLAPLADNGGSTPTLLPAPTSPVVDRGISGGFTADQRGFARIFDATQLPNAGGGGDGADIGSVEITLPPPVSVKAKCRGQEATIIARTGETTRGTPARDVIVGTASNDKIKALGGNDLVCAEDGNDKVFGGKGRDKLIGGAGRDLLVGGKGRDRLKGGTGKDTQKQ